MPLTIEQALAEGRRVLQQAGVETASLDASVLLSEAGGISREVIIGYPEKVLEETAFRRFETYIARRAKHEPVAYILGRREFWGMEFKVNPATLIPRPDSETVIEAVLALFQQKKTPLRVLDMGTGTGCLLLAVLAEYQNAVGLGVDASPLALQVAEENARNLGLERRVQWLESNWGAAVQEGGFDLILSNPPYIRTGDMAGLQQDVRDYEPHSALAAGEDGLNDYRALQPDIARLLAEGGYAVLEFGQRQEAEVVRILTETGALRLITTRADLSGTTRCGVFGRG